MGQRKGCVFSDEHREKLRLAKLGKPRGPRPPLQKARIACGKIGKPMSDEHKAAISRGQKARYARRALGDNT